MNKTIIDIIVKPNSSKREIKPEGDSIRVWLHSPPADGRANKELIDILASRLKVPKSGIEILKGVSGRNKRVVINGLSGKELFEKLWPSL